MTVLVVGAGIAGLCAALALRPHAEVLVLERRSHVAANAGAGIQLSPNAIKALDVIGAREVVEAHSTAPRGLHIGAAGRRAPLAEIDYGLMEKRFGAPYRTASRAGLHEALLIAAAQAGITICFDTTVDTLEPSGTGWVIPDAGAGDRGGISARNGGIAPLVIAADGVSSALRQRMLDDTPTETGACAWRGTAPMAEGESSFTRLTLSRQCHLVRYVLPDARDNAVFVSSLSRPPANLGDNPITTALTGVSQWVPWPIKVQPKHRYGIGTMAFIGDAAHAMPPYLAQGGAMAIEDAAVLSAAVARHGLTAEAVAHYGAQRTGRVKRLAAQTRRQGLIYHLPPPISFGRDMALRTLGAEGVLSQVSWIYGWNPPTP